MYAETIAVSSKPFMMNVAESLRVVSILVLCYNVVYSELITTKYGDVKGKSLRLHNGKFVTHFLGIPYAKPPIGPLRWKVRLLIA